MASKTTTTTTTESRKDKDGEWEEYHRTVTTVVERDDEGYPYGPVPYAPFPHFTADYANRRYGQGGWSDFYRRLGAVPADTKEDRQDG